MDSITEAREQRTYEFNTVTHLEKHRKPITHCGQTGQKKLVKALTLGLLDDIPSILSSHWESIIYPSDCTTILVPKEKELKKQERFFSVQKLRDQVYQAVSEMNIKEHVMSFISTHSMTMSPTLQHVLDKFAGMSTTSSNFVINLDYSSWCNHFQPEVQHAMCRLGLFYLSTLLSWFKIGLVLLIKMIKRYL